MKFGRYLEENLTPEWKRAYIDYRACKKAIKVIARRLGQAKDGASGEDEGHSSADEDHGPSAQPKSPSTVLASKSPRFPFPQSGRLGGLKSPKSGPELTGPPSRAGKKADYGATTTTSSPQPISYSNSQPPPLDIGESSYADRPGVPARNQTNEATLDTPQQDGQQRNVSFKPDEAEGPRSSSEEAAQSSGSGSAHQETDVSEAEVPLTPRSPSAKRTPRIPSKSPRFSPRTSPKKPFTPRFTFTPHSFQGSQSSGGNPAASSFATHGSVHSSVRQFRTFADFYESLEGDEKAFFDLLSRELEKVEAFYVARVQEAQRRGHEIRQQLKELAEHRRIYHELFPEGLTDWEVKVARHIPERAIEATGIMALGHKLHLRIPYTHRDGHVDMLGNAVEATKDSANGKLAEGMSHDDQDRIRRAIQEDQSHEKYSPETYQKYKRELRKATLDHYRYLELVKNYRILNLTGFRKALKKFEKMTKILCMELYTDEIISPESFAHGEEMEHLLKQTEEMFSDHFEHGDSKKARDRLRKQDTVTTHYSSTFRSGVYIGLGLPPAILAIALSRTAEAQAAIPQWEALLQIYGSIYLPVLFSILFELNLDAWVGARINYEFVMELSSPTIDYRSYLEVPAFLFMTLSFCFFFSFYRVGESNVAPTTWPAGWLVFLAVFWLNPLPIFRRSSRYWLLRVLARVLTPGYSRVEFIAFFLADELTSLIYTIENIYFIGCVYGKSWPDNTFKHCPVGANWPYGILLCLPALARLIQSVKRWHDSKLGIHLINAGKYFSIICQLSLFVVWRHRGSSYHDPAFIVWIIIATISASYACAWDFVVDWSLLRPGSKGLRPDLGYSYPIVYYCAMVINFLLRFIFVWYLPYPSQHTRSRSFFFALAEMLRRFQWNFFRVETEHLGNADAYRVTREIPLPYRRVEQDEDSDENPLTRKTSAKSHTLSVQLDKLRKNLVGKTAGGRGPEALDVGPRGHAPQREYEARRPGDSTSPRLDQGEV